MRVKETYLKERKEIMITAKTANLKAIDAHIGQRLKQRRIALGFSQSDIADRLGLTFQQVQKFEKGVNKLTAARLFELAQQLDTTVEYFYEGLDGSGDADASEDFGIKSRQALAFVRAYRSVKNPELRSRLLTLTRSLSRTS